MAGKRIKSLAEVVTMADGDFTIMDNNSSSDSKKITKENFLKEIQAEVDSKQDAEGNLTLATVDKSIIGAINEVNSKVESPEASTVTIVDSGHYYSSGEVEGALQEIGETNLTTKKYAGFENRTDSTISVNSVSGVFTIEPTTSSYNIYINGYGKYNLTVAQNVTVTSDQSITYIYFNSSAVLQSSTSMWDLASGESIPVAIVFKDGSYYATTDERHGYERNRAWHRWAHDNIGAMYKSGLTGTFTDTSLSVTQGVVCDEDIQADTGGTETHCSLWYRNATSGMRMVRDSLTPYYASAGVLQYDNGSGTLQPVTNNRYSTQWVYATHDDVNHIYVVVGQNNVVTIDEARNATLPTINLSTAEWKLIYRVIYRNVGGVTTYVESADFRRVQTGVPTSAITTDHAALINRDALNSHPAEAISYDNTITGLTATNVQDAIDEVTDVRLGGITFVAITQAAYDLITPDPLIHYIVTP